MKTPDIKPKINIAELVDAFRAQEQERLDIHAAEVAQRNAEKKIEVERNAQLINDVRPALEEVAAMLPNGRVFVPANPYRSHYDKDWHTNILEIEWTWEPRHSNGGYTISRRLSAFFDSEVGLPRYMLTLGEEGGLLLKDADEVPTISSTHNFADIILPFVRWAGLSKANNW
jgi:predicted DNA-binding protein (UPF0251 family)